MEFIALIIAIISLIVAIIVGMVIARDLIFYSQEVGQILNILKIQDKQIEQIAEKIKVLEGGKKGNGR